LRCAKTANLIYDGAEDRWEALQASDIYEQRAYLTGDAACGDAPAPSAFLNGLPMRFR